MIIELFFILNFFKIFVWVWRLMGMKIFVRWYKFYNYVLFFKVDMDICLIVIIWFGSVSYL